MQLSKLPRVKKIKTTKNHQTSFPLEHYSASSMRAFSVNPILFRIKYLNREIIDSTHSPVLMLGNAFHNAMEVYYGGSNEVIVTDEQDAIKKGLEVGLDFIDKYPDGMVGWNTTYQNKQQVMDKFSFAFQSYVQEVPYTKDTILSLEEELNEKVEVEWRGQTVELPVALKGYTDKIIEEDGKLVIVDYKTCSSFSDPDKIDAYKILQAVIYYFLVYAKYGREPYSMRYQEVKVSKNRDGGPQVKEYEIVFAENELFFDFFLRYYDDMTRAINGEMVWIPNIAAMYDNEIAIIAYINRLDVPEDVAAQMELNKVTNITDLLKTKIASANSMKKLLKTVEQQFITAKTMNYEDMTIEQRVETKMAEHGMLLKHVDTVQGTSVDLYRFTPSIGIKMSRIASYAADIEQVVGVSGVRILAPIPNSTYIGFEVPRTERVFHGAGPRANGINVPVGVDINGNTQYIDIESAPHILIAGTTGGGKSVMLRSILNSIQGNAEFWLADPKGVELHDLPSARYAEEPGDIRSMLEDLTGVMDARYKQLKEQGLRKWQGTSIVCVIDEFGDFILQNPEGFEMPNYFNWTQAALATELRKRDPERHSDAHLYEKKDLAVYLSDIDQERTTKYSALNGEQLVVKLAQKARAAGIHLIIATQSPRVTVVTGQIKANFPTRIALRTANSVESQIILDQDGAEKLLGKGDALILRSDSADLIRIQGYSV
jgi:FtsK/SpoIIIE family/PD-(D/E)XK nuclease superfamily/FtsK alpha domain